MNDFFVFVIEALCVYRITRLVVEDYLFQVQREAIIRFAYQRKGHSTGAHVPPGGWIRQLEDDDAPPHLAYLITCPWCASMYVAAVVAGLGAIFVTDWGVAITVAAAFAVSAVCGLIATFDS